MLHARLQHYANQELPDVQAGFRKCRGTRGQVPNIPWITEKARNFRKVCTSVSLTKPKPLDHHKLYKALRNGNTRPLTRLLRNLYACRSRRNSQNPDGTTGWFRVEKGVWQGCLLSRSLFNLYAEHIMRNVGLDELQAGIKIGGRNINSFPYVDDTTLISDSEELKSLLMRVKEECERAGVKLNIKKTKIVPSGLVTSWQIEGEMCK